MVRRWDAITGDHIGTVALGQPEDALAAYAGDPGAEVFRACVACHTLSPDEGNRAGPTLAGIFGRRIATLPGYNFSDALKKLDIVWTPETVAKLFEVGPMTYTPGTNAVSSVFTPTGGASLGAVTSTTTAGGINGGLIPGLSLTARNPLPGSAGTDRIAYHVTNLGVMQSLNDYLTKLTSVGGVFRTEQAQAQHDNIDLTAQIAAQNTLLAQKQTALQAQFTAMEVALAKINSQGSSLLSSLGVNNNTNSSSGG